MEETQEIGIATIRYNKDGTVQSTNFQSTLQVIVTDENLVRLGNEIQEHADIAFSSFFSKINDIELADRELYKVVSKPYKCIYFDSGKLKTCKLKFYFETLKKDEINRLQPSRD